MSNGLPQLQRVTKDPVTSEYVRICGLPFGYRVTNLDAFTRKFAFEKAIKRGFKFKQCQADAIANFLKFNGTFGMIVVGGGKTLIGVALPDLAYKTGKSRSLLLIPSHAHNQLYKRHLPLIRTWMPIDIPVHWLANKDRQERMAVAKAHDYGLWVYTYGLLSQPDSDDLLKEINPDVIICDEAQNLANKVSGRSKVFYRYLRERDEEDNRCLVVPMSGSFTQKKVTEYHPQITAALDKYSPLPRSPIQAAYWGLYLDVDASSGAVDPNKALPIRPLINWAKKSFPRDSYNYNREGFRKAYRQRLLTAPGVIVYSKGVSSDLVIRQRIPKTKEVKGWEKLKALEQQLEDKWVSPCGDEISYAIHLFKWRFELTAGFYYALVWPEDKVVASRKNISLKTAKEHLQKSKDHLAARQIFRKELRTFLTYTDYRGLNTDLQTMKGIVADDRRIPRVLKGAYWDMKKLEFGDLIKRDRIPERVCPFRIYDAANWAEEFQGKGGIVWYSNEEVGEWLEEEFRKRNLDFFLARKTSASREMLCDPANAHKIALAPVKAHGTGLELQHFNRCYYVQWPRQGTLVEQSIGRIQRTGQAADEVNVYRTTCTNTDELILAATLAEACYTTETTSIRQMLLYATWDKMPRIYSPEYLRIKGALTKDLSYNQRLLLKQAFGDYQDASRTT